MIHGILERCKRVVFDEIEVRRGLHLIGKNHDDAHPRGTRFLCKSVYPHIVPSNRSSNPDHLSSVLVRMLVQVTKGCFYRLCARSRPTESTETQEKNGNQYPGHDPPHCGFSCFCCCLGGWIALWMAFSRRVSIDSLSWSTVSQLSFQSLYTLSVLCRPWYVTDSAKYAACSPCIPNSAKGPFPPPTWAPSCAVTPASWAALSEAFRFQFFASRSTAS